MKKRTEFIIFLILFIIGIIFHEQILGLVG